MKKLTKKFKAENTFFISSTTNKITYCNICKKCINKCKQSYKAKLINCPKFIKK